jgi:hypothetical protein
MQVFRSESTDRLLAILFDGDNQGKQYQKDVSTLSKRLDVRDLVLEGDLAIEDYCLYPDLFLEAVFQTMEASFGAMDKKVPDDLVTVIKTSWDKFRHNRAEFAQKKKTSKERKGEESATQETNDTTPEILPEQQSNAGAWFKALSKKQLNNGSSKVALARNYAFLSREKSEGGVPDAERLRLAKPLVSRIIKELNLPSQRARREIES